MQANDWHSICFQIMQRFVIDYKILYSVWQSTKFIEIRLSQLFNILPPMNKTLKSCKIHFTRRGTDNLNLTEGLLGKSERTANCRLSRTSKDFGCYFPLHEGFKYFTTFSKQIHASAPPKLTGRRINSIFNLFRILLFLLF